MFLRSVLLLLVFATTATVGFSQKKIEYKQPRILILLDGSSSMINDWTKDENRFKAAGDIVLHLMDSIYNVNNQVEFSLRVYGHQHTVQEDNCYDTRREVSFSKNNYTQMSLRLASLQPLGVSPIAYSLKEAAENDFVSENDYAYSLVLITDGGESCGGNICDVVKSLLEKKIQFKPYIVSLVDYAPLKDQYNCLGNYLTVSKPGEIASALHTITEAYRKVLAIPIAKPQLLKTTNIPAPSAQKIRVGAVKAVLPEQSTAAAKQPETTVVTKPVVASKEPVKDAPKPQPEATRPVKESRIQVGTAFPTKDKIATLNRIQPHEINFPRFWAIARLKQKPVPAFALPEQEEGVGSLSKPDAEPKPAPKPPAKKPVVIKPATIIKPPQKEATFTTQLEPSPETTLEVYFTNGKGKFYTTTPPMQLMDVKTGREVKKFYRTTDASGNPDPQSIPAGKYTMVIGKSGNYVASNVTVKAGNHNKVTVIVTKGSLHFYYRNNPKRPITEFVGVVKRNFEAAPTVVQKGTEELEYEPGNYHIEFNTLPVEKRNVDLDFGVMVAIDIAEPGYVQFTNTDPIGKLYLWYPLGDQFVRFYGMDLNGNSEAQKLRLQPGIYEAHWKKNPKLPLEPDQVQRFRVKSNETTEVELK
jgi:hypothetical protein